MTVMQRRLLRAATGVLGLILGLSALSYVGYAFQMATSRLGSIQRYRKWNQRQNYRHGEVVA